MSLRNFKTLKRFHFLGGLMAVGWACQKQETMCPLTLATSDSPCYDSSWAVAEFLVPERLDEIRKGLKTPRFSDRVFFLRKDLWGRKRGADLENLCFQWMFQQKDQATESWRFKGHEVFKLLRCSNYWGNCQKYNTQAERLACRATATTYCNAKFLDFARFFSRKFWGVRRATGFQHVFLLWG